MDPIKESKERIKTEIKKFYITLRRANRDLKRTRLDIAIWETSLKIKDSPNKELFIKTAEEIVELTAKEEWGIDTGVEFNRETGAVEIKNKPRRIYWSNKE